MMETKTSESSETTTEDCFQTNDLKDILKDIFQPFVQSLTETLDKIDHKMEMMEKLDKINDRLEIMEKVEKHKINILL